MTIAIIGAGFTGLTAAYELVKKGHDVTVYEKDARPGGLAIGYEKKQWDWSLEHHYHHWFTNDDAVLGLAREIHYPVAIKRPVTAVYVNGHLYQMDSPLKVLSFPELPLIDRIRMAAVLAFLKFNPFWQPLERYRAESFLQTWMGKRAYDMLWKPQLYNKFGSYAPTISLAWFWARIVKRTPDLAYPKKGFLSFAESLVAAIRARGGSIEFSTDVTSVSSQSSYATVMAKKNTAKKTRRFDAVLVTSPNIVFSHIVSGISASYNKKLRSFDGIGAMNLVLRLKKPFFKNNTYWLSICDMDAPIMAVVEHTNFMQKKSYHGEHVVYVGNYLSQDAELYKKSDAAVLQSYDSFLKRLQPNYRKNLIGYDVFRVPFAQPIITTNYSKKLLSIKTPVPHIYLANMQQVYPWDRGTNYAVELGIQAANAILESSE